MHTKIKLYRAALSGHSHRAQLMLSLLNLPYEIVDVDMAKGAHKAPEFLAMNPFGTVPVIDDDRHTVADSNAILVYLAKTYASGSHWLPDDPKAAAEVQRWLTIAAHQIFAGPCSARLVTVFGAPLDHGAAIAKAHDLLKIMDVHLTGRMWLAADTITIADVAAYSYVAHAPEGGVSLDNYPQVRAWLGRIEAQPHFVGMAKSPIHEVA